MSRPCLAGPHGITASANHRRVRRVYKRAPYRRFYSSSITSAFISDPHMHPQKYLQGDTPTQGRSSPTYFHLDKHHDPDREPDNPHRPTAPTYRMEMVKDMRGKIVWLSKKSFKERLLPPPPAELMSSTFPRPTIKKLSKKLEKMRDGYKKRARKKNRREEEQLADEFVSIFCNTCHDLPLIQAFRPKSSTTTSCRWLETKTPPMNALGPLLLALRTAK